ncbi:MAG TPA: hypothetical protein VHF25_14615 [Nitriliruptorales bacterium]|nr:hypothetical protein [Nitriliruptorales bacterium]
MVQPVYSARERPFALPTDLEDLEGPKARGVVTLPLHIDWSRQRSYDLDDRADRRRLYEQVLREGTLEDLRRYIDVDHLVDVWEELYLPAEIKQAWWKLLTEERGLQLRC